MSVENALQAGPLPASSESPPPKVARPPRVWLPLAILGLYWGTVIGSGFLELPYFFRFLFGMVAPLLLLIAFSIWWWTRSSISRLDRLLGFLVIVGGAFVTAPLTHTSAGLPQMLMVGLPIVITVSTLWTLLSQRLRIGVRRLGALALILLTWGSMTLVRSEGVDGNLKADLHWRWTPTAEEVFLASKSAGASGGADATSSPAHETLLAAAPGDWTEFRGANRDGVVTADSLATDWKDWSKTPPSPVWKQRIGPAWSSVIIVGERLFTQEQRGEKEAVVCYEAATGKELWAHEDATRFYEAVSGTGPRSTPTFVDGRLYTLGATGILNCLDAATGRLQWTHDLRIDAHATIPLWGLSGSPLVTDGLVVVYGGGLNQNNLLAFHIDSGAPAWTAETGGESYSSPQLSTVAGVPQILMVTDGGLAGFDPATGEKLWKGGTPIPNAPRPLQPHLVGGDQLFTGALNGFSATLLRISRSDTGWAATEAWTCSEVKPEFSDFVIHAGHAYGFDGAIFCCVDLTTGKRAWKGGRYGRGQVVLLPVQSLLVVLSETGEAILVAARPEKHQELARFQAITGKTWNHPVIAHGKLYARNAEEIACYDLAAP